MTPSPLPSPLTPSQLNDILNQACYDGHSHSLDMIVHVPAGVQASEPAARLVVWRNHTAESVRIEVTGGWPVVGLRLRERTSEATLFGYGLASRQGHRFAQPGQVCPRCGRTFAPFEVVAADGDCADRDQCVADAGAYKLPLQRPYLAWQGRQPIDPEREERLGQYRVARNLRQEVARRASQRQPSGRSTAADIRP